MSRLVLIAATVLISVVLTLAMWISGKVPFDFWTTTMHLISIYIGAGSGVLVAEWRRGRTSR